MEIKIGNYQVTKKLGKGAFGEVYMGKHADTGKEVAIKMESVDSKFPQLFHEAKILKALKGSKGIPDIKHYTTVDEYYVMIFELLGPCLEDLFKYCKRKFSIKTVCMIAIQILDRIEVVHMNHLIHRDIKPENFLIGHAKPHLMYMIDFGLAKRFREPKTGMHIPWKENKNLTGTARYASLNTHLGYEQSRRDDLEGLAYMLIYFCKGILPWQGLAAKTKKEKYKQIKNK